MLKQSVWGSCKSALARYHILICSAIGFLFSLSLSAQTLYMPRNVKQAYLKGTRSMDGNPGKNYWQNFARYSIDIIAAPPDRNIRGKETILYFNNSPDTLRNPSIKLFLNVHKPGAPRDDSFEPDYLNDGIYIDKLTVNGQILPVNNESTFTNLFLPLPKALAPRDSVQFSFDWHYQISLGNGREGMVDSTTFFLGLFYPRVAVFDDYCGWDRIPYTESREFYSDFNDYDVTIQVPGNFVVWGTGTLQDPEKLLQPAILKRFERSWNSDEIIRIVTPEDIAEKKVTTQNPVNKWHFIARNIPDVVFGLSDHYVWDGASVVVDDVTGRRSGAQAAYNDTTKEYHYITSYTRHSLDWFSHHWPDVPFLYEKMTYFQTFDEMEYPMVIKGSAYGDTSFARFVAEHEIAHTYFPFYMGTNETRFGFMDEGWATTFELLIGRDDIGVEQAESFYRRFRVAGWINDPAAGEDMPIINPTENVTGAALAIMNMANHLLVIWQ